MLIIDNEIICCIDELWALYNSSAFSVCIKIKQLIPTLQYPGTCPQNTFRCSNGKCIATLLTCDGDNNCGDGSDEMAPHCIQGLSINV